MCESEEEDFLGCCRRSVCCGEVDSDQVRSVRGGACICRQMDRTAWARSIGRVSGLPCMEIIFTEKKIACIP